MYKLEYLPSALEDMIEIVRYISVELGNPTAAENLADKMIKSTEHLEEMPYINPVYYPIRPLSREYRKLLIKNYIMFYWVEEEPEKKVTIARVLYAKSDYGKDI